MSTGYFKVPPETAFPIFVKAVTALGLLLLINQAPDGWADEQQSVREFFCPSQEQTHTSGVWVSRPRPADEKVLSLLRINNIQTLQEYTQWLNDNTSYQKDTVDVWASPEETLLKKHGDCEDFAFLNAQVLQLLGYKTHILALSLKPRDHAVCAFAKDGYYFWFDNNHLKETAAQNLADLAKQISLEYPFQYIFEYLDKSKDWKILFPVS